MDVLCLHIYTVSGTSVHMNGKTVSVCVDITHVCGMRHFCCYCGSYKPQNTYLLPKLKQYFIFCPKIKADNQRTLWFLASIYAKQKENQHTTFEVQIFLFFVRHHVYKVFKLWLLLTSCDSWPSEQMTEVIYSSRAANVKSLWFWQNSFTEIS